MGPVGLGIAAVAISTISAGYGIYAGERAAIAQKRQAEQARKDMLAAQAKQDAQMAQDKADMAANLAEQKKTQEETNTKLAAEQEAARQKSLAAVPGMQQQLGSDLLAQQQAAYTKMAPQMETRLNALGLLQSGALPEAQAKYQGDLETQRQAKLAQFGMDAQNQLSILQPQALSESDVVRQSNAMSANLSTSRDNLSQQFANQNIANQNNIAYQQYVGNLQAAQTAADQQRANAYMNFGGQLAQGGLSYYGSKQNPSLSALDQYRSGKQWGTDYSIPMTSY